MLVAVRVKGILCNKSAMQFSINNILYCYYFLLFYLIKTVN